MSRRRGVRRGLAGLLGLLLPVAAAVAPAAAEVRRVEAVGVVPVPDPAPSRATLRDRALRAGIQEAVLRVAREQIEAQGTETELEPRAMAALLGGQLVDYTVRFRILEDRGERDALLLAATPASREYVLVTEVHVEVERVREKLVEVELVAPQAAPAGPRRRVAVVIQPLPSYAALRWVQEALGAVPYELSRTGAVLVVETHESGPELLARLRRGSPPGVRVVSRSADEARLALAVEGVPSAPRD